MLFSVGDIGALLDGVVFGVVVVVVVVVLDGAWLPVVEHPAVSTAIAMSTAAATRVIRSRERRNRIMGVLSITCCGERQEAPLAPGAPSRPV
jgi:hypothetical protein